MLLALEQCYAEQQHAEATKQSSKKEHKMHMIRGNEANVLDLYGKCTGEVRTYGLGAAVVRVSDFKVSTRSARKLLAVATLRASILMVIIS